MLSIMTALAFAVSCGGGDGPAGTSGQAPSPDSQPPSQGSGASPTDGAGSGPSMGVKDGVPYGSFDSIAQIEESYGAMIKGFGDFYDDHAFAYINTVSTFEIFLAVECLAEILGGYSMDGGSLVKSETKVFEEEGYLGELEGDVQTVSAAADLATGYYSYEKTVTRGGVAVKRERYDMSFGDGFVGMYQSLNRLDGPAHSSNSVTYLRIDGPRVDWVYLSDYGFDSDGGTVGMADMRPLAYDPSRDVGQVKALAEAEGLKPIYHGSYDLAGYTDFLD